MPTLEWIGKDKVVNHHLEVPYRVLEEQYTYNAETSENMIIRGDNLEALKALLPRYEGKVKCIYIDPPYNTGNEGWVYNDNVNDPRIKKWLGEVVGKEGEDLSRHDKWLCMMYPRLKLLHRLLAEDGVIFISIDDTEFSYLRLICDEIFRNFAEAIVWQKRTSPDARKRLSSGHEYVLIYTKNPDQNLGLKLLPLEGKDAEAYTNPDNDPRGPWISSPFTAPGYRPNQMYPITTPTGKTVTPPKGRCWSNIEEVYQRLLSEGRMWFGADGNGVPRRKTYLSEREGRGVWTWWTNSEVDSAKIREYVYFMETKTAIEPDKEDEPYYMGVHLDSAYYFYYQKDSVTSLNRDFLRGVKTKAERYTIYADLCTLSPAELEQYHITFKKIPRDISRL